MPRDDNYPDDIRSYDHDPRSPFYSGQGLVDAVQDAEDEYCHEHAKLLAHLERLEIPHTVSAESDADEDGYNVSVRFQLETYGADGCEVALLAAVKDLEPTDAAGIAAAIEIGHENVD